MNIISAIRGWFSEAPHFTGTIVASERIGSRIQKVTVELSHEARGPFPIGSYIVVYAWGCIPRAYSIAKTGERSFTLLVSFSGGGAGARFFRDSKIGTRALFYGPFDDFPYRYGTGRSKIFFATSTGVAPFRMMIDEALKENLPATLLLGSPKESDIALKDEFLAITERDSRFTFIPTLSNPDPEWNGARGFVTDYIGAHPDIVKQSDIYICGIPAMTVGVLAALKNAGVPEEQIFVQKFG